MKHSHRTTHLSRLIASLAGLVALLLTASALAEDPTLLWTAQGGANICSMEAIEDVDGDGGPDIVFESYNSGSALPDHLFCVRGASAGTGEVIWGAWPPGGVSNGGGWGENCLRVSPDITGDGVQDVLLGTAWGGRSAYVLDGTNGDDIWWTFDTYADSPPSPPTSGWVYSIDDVPDLTGDGVPEVTFCTGSFNYGVYMVNGATGGVIWYYQHSGPFMEVRCVGDVNGDGRADVAAGSGDQNYVLKCFSGPGAGGSPSTLWTVNYAGTIWSLIPVPTIDADPLPEIVAACWDGRVRCHDGANGGAHWTSENFGAVIQRVVLVGDVNGNGVGDIIVGMWDNRVAMLEGATGATIWTQWTGTLNGGDCWAVDGTGDVTGDGIPEVVVGSFDTRVYLMDGVDGAILWSYPTGNRLYSVRGVPDLNGNGTPDFIAGTQMQGGVGGKVYAFDGPAGGADVDEAPAAAADGPALRLWPSPLRAGVETLSWSVVPGCAGDLRLEVAGADGRVARTLWARSQGGGGVRGVWDGRDANGRDLPAGVYWLRAVMDERPLAGERIVVLR
jgi:hypothetical protein